MKTCWGQTTCVVNTDGIDCISKVIVLNYKCMTGYTAYIHIYTHIQIYIYIYIILIIY